MRLSYRVVLYGTPHCHLCDEAKALLQGVDVVFETVDITQTEPLVATYGMRIPVLQRLDSGAELGWPFDIESVKAFLSV